MLIGSDNDAGRGELCVSSFGFHLVRVSIAELKKFVPFEPAVKVIHNDSGFILIVVPPLASVLVVIRASSLGKRKSGLALPAPCRPNKYEDICSPGPGGNGTEYIPEGGESAIISCIYDGEFFSHVSKAESVM